MIGNGLDPADRELRPRPMESQRYFEPRQQTWTTRVGWHRPRRPMADRRSGALTNFLPPALPLPISRPGRPTNLRASQPGNMAFRVVRAAAILAVGFPMIDPLHFKARMKNVPSSRLVGIDNAASDDATTNDRDGLGLTFHDCRHGRAASVGWNVDLLGNEPIYDRSVADVPGGATEVIHTMTATLYGDPSDPRPAVQEFATKYEKRAGIRRNMSITSRQFDLAKQIGIERYVMLNATVRSRGLAPCVICRICRTCFGGRCAERKWGRP
jgi:hypothetical protein